MANIKLFVMKYVDRCYTKVTDGIVTIEKGVILT